MHKQLFVAALAIASVAACKTRSDPVTTSADNTARNGGERAAKPTADEAVKSTSDLDLTKQIRKAIIDDGSLSTNAHNCKVVVQNGIVTLVGPVANETERTRVADLAVGIAGNGKVVNQLEVTH